MTELTTRPTPRISEHVLRKLQAFGHAKPLTADSTAFDMGYERCKQDFLEVLQAATGEPVRLALPRGAVVATQAAENKELARKHNNPWWKLL
jgi:hypothetical protein